MLGPGRPRLRWGRAPNFCLGLPPGLMEFVPQARRPLTGTSAPVRALPLPEGRREAGQPAHSMPQREEPLATVTSHPPCC